MAYVSRSGGMSNELNNIVAQNADGVYEGVAIGGDRYAIFRPNLFIERQVLVSFCNCSPIVS